MKVKFKASIEDAVAAGKRLKPARAAIKKIIDGAMSWQLRARE